MMHRVSPEKAVELKAAGFPQPTPEAGQIWYEIEEWCDPVQIYITSATKRKISYVILGVNLVYNDHLRDICLFYAPTATEILAHLEPDFCIMKTQENKFQVKPVPLQLLSQTKAFENPADGAAVAYLNR